MFHFIKDYAIHVVDKFNALEAEGHKVTVISSAYEERQLVVFYKVDYKEKPKASAQTKVTSFKA